MQLGMVQQLKKKILTALGASLTTSLPLCWSIVSVQAAMASVRISIPWSCLIMLLVTDKIKYNI